MFYLATPDGIRFVNHAGRVSMRGSGDQPLLFEDPNSAHHSPYMQPIFCVQSYPAAVPHD